ncbi:beta-lactamase/transpeptidase-like protein [Mycena rebaudengoi]|nr:beta-lactamase/transpeptidase-like protein [Mycena rebaudengoi]
MTSLSAAQRDNLDFILAKAAKDRTIPHVFVGVTNVKEEIYMQVGTNPRDNESSGFVDEDSIYMLCSQTKFITAIAAMKLIEQGKITVDTPVEEVLPELANPVVVTEYGADSKPSATTSAKSKITFGQLLNHSSGLDYYVDGTISTDSMLPSCYTMIYKDNRSGVSEFFRLNKGSLPGQPLRFEPGTGFAYGFGNDCAGFVIERLSGKSLEEYFHEYIFAPLGIKSMSFYPTPDIKARLLPLTFRKDDRSLELFNDRFTVLPRDPADIKVHLGGVGLYGSLKDYLKILRHVLQIKAGTATNPILSASSVDQFFKPTLGEPAVEMLGPFMSIIAKELGMPPGAQQYSYGLALTTVDVPEKRRAWSGAWGGWANTSFFLDPESGVAVVLGTQIVPTGDTEYGKLFNEIERALYAGLVPVASLGSLNFKQS